MAIGNGPAERRQGSLQKNSDQASSSRVQAKVPKEVVLGLLIFCQCPTASGPFTKIQPMSQPLTFKCQPLPRKPQPPASVDNTNLFIFALIVYAFRSTTLNELAVCKICKLRKTTFSITFSLLLNLLARICSFSFRF